MNSVLHVYHTDKCHTNFYQLTKDDTLNGIIQSERRQYTLLNTRKINVYVKLSVAIR